MPQKKSYFALQLLKRWLVFGLNLALLGDIDVYQFKFFSDLVKNEVFLLFLFCYFNTLLKISQVDEIGDAPTILPNGMLTAWELFPWSPFYCLNLVGLNLMSIIKFLEMGILHCVRYTCWQVLYTIKKLTCFDPRHFNDSVQLHMVEIFNTHFVYKTH